MHDALRADVHVAAGGHLAVLRHAQGVEALPIVRLAVVGDHHPVGHHHARGVGVAGEEAERMAAVHHQGLLIGHLRQVAHGEAILGPVLEHRAVATVGDQLVRVLGHGGIQVVLDHQHDGRRLPALRGVMVDGPRMHGVLRAQTMHVDASEVLQLLRELRRQRGVVLRVEVAQGIAQGQLLLLGRQDVLALGRVAHARVERAGGRQDIGNAFTDGLLEGLEVGGRRGAHDRMRPCAVRARVHEVRHCLRKAKDGERSGTLDHPTFPLPFWSWKP